MLLDPPWVAAHLPQLTGGLIPRSVHSYLAGVEKWLVPTILRAGLGLALGLAARLAEVLRRREIQLDAARPPTARPPPSGSLTGWSVPACRFPVHQKGGNSAKKCSKKFAPQERFTSSPNNSAPGVKNRPGIGFGDTAKCGKVASTIRITNFHILVRYKHAADSFIKFS